MENDRNLNNISDKLQSVPGIVRQADDITNESGILKLSFEFKSVPYRAGFNKPVDKN